MKMMSGGGYWYNMSECVRACVRAYVCVSNKTMKEGLQNVREQLSCLASISTGRKDERMRGSKAKTRSGKGEEEEEE